MYRWHNKDNHKKTTTSKTTTKRMTKTKITLTKKTKTNTTKTKTTKTKTTKTKTTKTKATTTSWWYWCFYLHTFKMLRGLPCAGSWYILSNLWLCPSDITTGHKSNMFRGWLSFVIGKNSLWESQHMINQIKIQRLMRKQLATKACSDKNTFYF